MQSFAEHIGIATARDIRNTFRIWRRNPGTTLVAYLALTIGICATTTIFSILSSLLLRPLPVGDEERVVRVTGLDKSGDALQLTMPDALDVKKRLTMADGFAIYQENIANFAGRARPAMVHVLHVGGDLAKVMGLRMAEGRDFAADANKPGQPCSVLLSWKFWQTQFGGLAVSGQTIRLNERPCVVEGVLPEGLDLPEDAELWTPEPFDLQSAANSRQVHSWYGLAHLKPGATVASFNAELKKIGEELSREHPVEDTGLSMRAVLLRDYLNREVRESLWILFAAISAVLLLACANVANLLLARSSARLREISVRRAVGAGRAALFQQLMTESLLLALAAALSGLILTMAAVRALRDAPNLPIPRPENIAVDWRVLLFAIGMAVVTGLAFGTLPALRVTLTPIMTVLRQAGGQINESRHQQLLPRVLVCAETGIATLLLIASSLLVRSFKEVSRVDPGFKTDHLLTAYVSLPPERYGQDTMDTVRFANRVLDSLKNQAGIEAATIATSVPLQGTDGESYFQIEGRAIPQHEADYPIAINTGISPSFRKTLGIRLIAGRDLEESDNHDGGSTLLVNAAFAKRFFASESAVGKRLRFASDRPWLEIVGVIGDVHQFGLESKAQPEMFMPLSISINPFPGVLVRTKDSPLRHLREVENSVQQADADVPVFLPRSMEQVEAHSLRLRTFNTALLGSFAWVAWLLAAGGLFAVIAYTVSQRTSEIGVRMACGASPADVVWLIVRQGMIPALIGMLAGLLGSIVLSRYLEGLLFGVTRTDATTYIMTVLIVTVSSAIAAFIPARRAAKVQPWRALRYE